MTSGRSATPWSAARDRCVLSGTRVSARQPGGLMASMMSPGLRDLERNLDTMRQRSRSFGRSTAYAISNQPPAFKCTPSSL